jgi:hypothetical protein
MKFLFAHFSLVELRDLSRAWDVPRMKNKDRIICDLCNHLRCLRSPAALKEALTEIAALL